jgi:hypothetical protein
MEVDDRGISDAFFTVMSIGIVMLAGIMIANVVLSMASSQGQAAADRLEGLQEQGQESRINAFYYTIDPAISDLASADPNKIPPDGFIALGVAPTISLSSPDLPKGVPATDGLIIWTGYIVVPAEGDYTFTLDSAGGSWLWIDGKLTLENHGNHPLASASSAPVHLAAGQHKLKARYFYTSTAICKVTCTQGGVARELRYCH